jgi:hypothetical protein
VLDGAHIRVGFEKDTEGAIVGSFDKLDKTVTRYVWPHGNSITVDERSLAFAIDPS